jgi:hypothetical protein
MTAILDASALLKGGSAALALSPLGKSAGWFILDGPQAAVQRQALGGLFVRRARELYRDPRSFEHR